MKIEKDGLIWVISAKLNPAEKKFIEEGKRVWCTGKTRVGTDEFWAAAFLEKGRGVVQGKFKSEEEAVYFTLSFANMQDDKTRHAVFHKIKRPGDWPPNYLTAQ